MSTSIATGPQHIIRAGQWAAGVVTAQAASVPMHIPVIAAWALTYVQPLREMFDDLLGDPAQVESVAGSWEGVERTLVGVAYELERVERQLDDLDSRTVRTLRLRYEDLIPTAQNAAEWSGSVAAAAKLASSVVAGVRQFIFDFLESVARLVRALFGFTLNPFDKAEDMARLVEAVFTFAAAGRQLIDSMLTAFADLIGLLQSLGPAIDEALTKLREGLSRMLPIAGALYGGFQGARVGLFAGGPLGGLLGGALGFVGGGSAGAAARDMLVDGGDVTRVNSSDIDAARAALVNDQDIPGRVASLDSKHLTGLSDLVQSNSLTDRLGGKDSTAIDVKLVRDAEGNEHWVVSLPSTQEWLDSFGKGAMNDRNTNLSLMFMDDPALKSQYEAAVLRAMREAGMAPNDPVVFTGFSQGGIMAANLAADTTLPYRTIGVVTNGSPIDSFNIPPHIPVVAFQHANDPVAMLDGNVFGETPPNVRRVVLPPPGGTFDVVASHDNNNYAASIDKYQSGLSNEYSWMGGEIIDHQVFEAVQR